MCKEKNYLRNSLILLAGLSLTVIIVEFAVANLFHFTRYMDSDIASDALLAELLSQNDFSVPDTWYGSAEKQITSVPNIAAIIYSINGNLNLAMGIASVIMTALLLFSMVYYYNSNGFTKLQTIAAILIPFMLSRSVSNSLKMIFLYASHYVSHMIFMFVIYAFYAQALRNGNELKKKHIFFSVIIAVIAGLQGMHGMLYIFGPILISEVLRIGIKLLTKKINRNDKYLFIWAICISFVSYVSVKCGSSYVQNTSRNIRHCLEKLITDVVPDIIETLSLYGLPLYLAYIIIFISLVGFTVAIYFSIKSFLNEKDNMDYGQKQLWSTLPFLFSFLLPIAGAMFTTADSTGRYYIGQMFVLGTGYAIIVGEIEKAKKISEIRQICIILIMFPLLLYGMDSIKYFYENLIANDQTLTSKNMQIINWLKENDCLYGYADFLKANEITVVSNDTVKIRALDSMTDLNGCKWLTDTRWYPPTKTTDGLTAYVLLPEEIEEFQTFLENENPTIVNYKVFDNLEVYILDKDYSMWVD